MQGTMFFSASQQSKPRPDALSVAPEAAGTTEHQCSCCSRNSLVLPLASAAAAATYQEMREVVQHAVSEIGLMEFMRFDVGAVLAKAHPERNPKSIRLIIGNPLIMESMARLVPDAASYAPVTVLIDRRSDGVHLSYDEMASLLAPYGNAEAVEIAGDLDIKVRRMLQDAS